MENLSLISSPNVILGVSPNPRNTRLNKPFLGFAHQFSTNSRHRKAASSLLVFASLHSPKSSKILVKSRKDHFSSITSSGQQTSSVGVNPQIPVQPASSNVGSPLFWVGIGVALSAVFSWVASKLKNYATQQAIKSLMAQMPTQNNQFSNPGFAPNVPFPFPPLPAQNTATSPPPMASSTIASEQVTVDVSASKVEESPASDIKASSEVKQEPKKYAFVDVTPEETVQKNAFENYKETIDLDSSKGFQNGAALKSEERVSQGSSTKEANPLLSVEALEKMMEDPTVQKMVYPYLPEEMRNPTTFKWMLQNPMYRQQLQDMLNNMRGSPEWDNKMMDTLKNFDLNSPEVKQQFDQIGLTPEEVISKIMANPDVAMAFQNPRIQQAIIDCSQNPINITKYQNDKEVMDVFNKISELFPGMSGSS